VTFTVDSPRQYYRVTSGPCWDILVAWREKRNAIDAGCFDFAKSVGGNGFFGGHDDNVGNALAISAVSFDGKLPEGWKQRKWKSLQVKTGNTAGWPDQRSKAGRAALAAIRALPLRPSSGKVCDAISHPHSLHYKTAAGGEGHSSLGFWDTALIGWSGDTFYLGLPNIALEKRRHEAQGDTVLTPVWEPWDGMEPILKEEMELDYARAKLAKAEAA
jgi:hypothetical protein